VTRRSLWHYARRKHKVKQHNIIIAALLLSFLICPIRDAHAQTDLPVVHAVLFYSPTCGHCEFVINQTLVPMLEKHGGQLQITAIDVTQPFGQELHRSALQMFGLERSGVPFLVFDDTYLIGSADIPEKFPSLVESYLAQGGLDLPAIPGLAEAMNANQTTSEPTPIPVPVVRAVLFYRSACSHCKIITDEVIPPLFEKYGAQLEIFGVDISIPEEYELYDIAIERFQIDRFGVPTLILGDQVLVGATEIEERCVSIIEGYLAQGGMDWPEIAGLQEAISKARVESSTPVASPQPGTLQTTPAPGTDPPALASPTATPGVLLTNSEPSHWRDRFAQDPAGNSLSVIVFLGMLGSVGWMVRLLKNTKNNHHNRNRAWIIPILCLVGFGVAGYLAYVETTLTTAVCGPVGDCNTVQQSEYARLFGVLPIGVLGLIGYIAIFVAWLIARFANNYLSALGSLSILVMTILGTLFSIYLTFLEPFVIGATCAWCLTSAVVITALMLLSAPQARIAAETLPGSKQ
jgi:uncharacterized membrane protein